MELAELEQALRSTDPAAFLLKPRFLRRVIKYDRQPPGIGLQVPHRKSHVIGREKLLQIVAADELGLADGQELPPTLLLIIRPYAHKVAGMVPELALVKYWRLLFHCRVHEALSRRFATLKSRPGEIRRRVHQLGHTELEEARRVLRQEKFLLPPPDDWTVYEELAAVYLELRYFSPFLLPHYFPTFRDYDRLDALLGEDLDVKEIFARTRLPGAPENPVLASVSTALEAARDLEAASEPAPAAFSAGRYKRLLQKAEKTAGLGNIVRAAIYKERAAYVGPAELREENRSAARGELDRLVTRLEPVLTLKPEGVAEWRQALAPLLHAYGPGIWPVEARLLYDLQKACVDHERGIYAVDLVEWAVTLGRRPIKRPLPRLREVHVVTYLRKALSRLAKIRVSDLERQRLSGLLESAVHHCEAGLREKFRPLIGGVLEKARLTPTNYPERIALNKLTEELLDRIVERGFLNIGDLRDAVSRNGLKLPDLGGVGQFFRGDKLLQIDRELAVTLDGVYRRGEIYMRWLQTFSSLAFGTVLGRLLMLYLVLPFGGAFVVLKGAQEVVHIAHKLTASPEEKWQRTLLGTSTVGLLGSPWGQGPILAAAAACPERAEHGGLRALEASILTLYTFVGLGVVLFGLFHSALFRRTVGRLLKWIWLGLRAASYDIPVAVARFTSIYLVFESPILIFIYRCLLSPLLIGLLAWPMLILTGHDFVPSLWASGGIFLVAVLFLNSRLGRDLEEASLDQAIRLFDRIRFGILPGIFRAIMGLFKWLLEWTERYLYSVDEWLRFKSGESRLTLVVKTVVGTIWFFVTYIFRIYINLLIEPTVNPIKHFPVVTVGHKLMVPAYPFVFPFLLGLFDPLGKALAYSCAGVTLFFIPGIFGFIVWELKENWRLYRANRPRTLKPALIGHHGETMIRLMRPGIHSGTLPKLFARLRKAERGMHRTGNWRAVHKQLEALHHVRECIHRFVERELVSLLESSKGWGGLHVHPGNIALGSNRVSIELICRDLSKEPLCLAFEDRSGWLVAGIHKPGWACGLARDQAQVLATALAGFYKLAGAQIVREQVESCLTSLGVAYDIAGDGLTVWALPDFDQEAVYRRGPEGLLEPHARGSPAPEKLPTFEPRQLLFAEAPVYWESWVEAWEQDQASSFPLKEVAEGVRLLPPLKTAPQ
jgi:hypothetical protein